MADGALCRGRRRAGRAARQPAGNHSERHHQRISLARLLCVSARSIAAPDQGSDPFFGARDAEMESDERLLLSLAGGRSDAGARTRLRIGDRGRGAGHGARLGRGRRGRVCRSRRAIVVFRQRRHALHHRARQNARLRRIVGRDHARALRHSGSRQAALSLRRASEFSRPHRTAAGKQRLSHPH